MKNNINFRNNNSNVFNRAWVRDTATGNDYSQDAMLIAVLAHVTGKDRSGMNGKIVRQLMQDQNLD